MTQYERFPQNPLEFRAKALQHVASANGYRDLEGSCQPQISPLAFVGDSVQLPKDFEGNTPQDDDDDHSTDVRPS